MTNYNQWVELGSFDVTSGKIRVSDPCYSKDTHCVAVLDLVKNGKWNCFVWNTDEYGWGNRNAILIAIHEENFDHLKLLREINEHVSDNIGVDSGQAGFFCESKYRGGEDDWSNVNGWYRKCCNATLNTDAKADIIDGGVVSSSGFGDGSYSLFCARGLNGFIIALRLEFIDEDDDHDEE